MCMNKLDRLVTATIMSCVSINHDSQEGAARINSPATKCLAIVFSRFWIAGIPITNRSASHAPG